MMEFRGRFRENLGKILGEILGERWADFVRDGRILLEIAVEYQLVGCWPRKTNETVTIV